MLSNSPYHDMQMNIYMLLESVLKDTGWVLTPSYSISDVIIIVCVVSCTIDRLHSKKARRNDVHSAL